MEQWDLAPSQGRHSTGCVIIIPSHLDLLRVSLDQTQLLREIKLQSLYHPLAGTLFVCSSWVLAIRRRKIVHSKLSAQKKICVVLKTA